MIRKPSLRRRRGADTAPAAEPIPAEPVTDGAASGSVALAVDPATQVVPAGPYDPSAPAGLEAQPAPVPPTPGFRDRGRLRRRLRYLRRVRELGFRDLGGLVFDLHRFGRDGGPLVAGKLEALAAVDTELRALEDALDDREELTVLREPGIAACPRCAALHGTDANFCPNCGLRMDGPQAFSPTPAGGPTPVPAPDAPPPVPAPVTAQPTSVQPALPPQQPTGVQPAADEQPTIIRRPEDQPTTAQPPVAPDAPGRPDPAP
jgi:hypothetical protein